MKKKVMNLVRVMKGKLILMTVSRAQRERKGETEDGWTQQFCRLTEQRVAQTLTITFLRSIPYRKQLYRTFGHIYLALDIQYG